MTTSHQALYRGTGRRKTARAQVKLTPGGGAVVINGKPLEQAIPLAHLRNIVTEPLRLTNVLKKYNAVVKVEGGGYNAQAIAIRHGISRALLEIDKTFRPALKAQGFLTRDSREKERKKYGLKRARKAPQYTKR